MSKADFDRAALVAHALEMRSRAYVPYSHMAVGAALLAADGRIFGGCNIENAAYSPTICAERCAVSAALAAGCREFVAIAVAGGPDGLSDELPQFFYPCGVCRQVLREFCAADMPVLTARSHSEWQELTLADILPYGFGPEHLA